MMSHPRDERILFTRPKPSLAVRLAVAALFVGAGSALLAFFLPYLR